MIGLFSFAGENSSDSGLASIADPRITQEDDRVRGEGNKQVTLIEYGDFGCPGCGGLHPLLIQLEAEFDSLKEGDLLPFLFLDHYSKSAKINS